MATMEKCIFPSCTYGIHSRGLCGNHYTTVLNLIKSGATSWEELENRGKCLPVKKRGTVRRWFLED